MTHRKILVLLATALFTATAANAQIPHHRGHHASSKLDYFYRLLPPDAPNRVGQDALGAIQQTVGYLLADPSTDWSKVSIQRLRQHLIDLDAVIERSAVEERAIDQGLEIIVDGDAVTLEAARRVVPAHITAAGGFRGWRAELDDGDAKEGVPLRLRLLAPSDDEAEILRALGFFGFLSSGVFHPGYHLALARGFAAAD